MFFSVLPTIRLYLKSRPSYLIVTILCLSTITRMFGAVNMHPTSGPTTGMIDITLTATASENFGTTGTLLFNNIIVPAVDIVTWSNSSITFKCPAGTGTGIQVQVTANGISYTVAQLFNFNPPVLQTMSPDTGPQGGNTVVTLTGQNFGNNQASIIVTIGSLPASNVQWNSHTSLSFTTPPGYGQEVSVIVTVAGQSSNVLPFHYTTTGSVGIGTNNPSNYLSIAGNTNIMGRLGIGTYSPTSNLHVAGKVRIADGSQSEGMVLTSDATGLASWKNVRGTDILTTPLEPQLNCPDSVGSVATANFPGAMKVSGNYAYVLNGNGNLMQVFNISNPESPVLAGSVSTGNLPKSLDISGNHVFVVNESGNTMQVFDVSNPATPNLVSTFNTGLSPVGLKISGNYAYVINRYGKTLQIINISNPDIPVLTGTFSTGTDSPFKLAVSGNYAYIVCDPGFATAVMRIVNISNPASPSQTGLIYVPLSTSAIEVSENYAYLSTSVSLSVYNITNPTTPFFIGETPDIQNSASLILKENNIYAIPSTPNRLAIIDKSDEEAPFLVNEINLPSASLALDIIEDYAYLLTANNLQIFKLTCTENQVISIDPTTGHTNSVPMQWKVSDLHITNSNPGNVGIGDFNPTNKLSVKGNTNITGNLGIGIVTPVNKLSVNGNADITGNMGIGMVNPTKKLVVSGLGGLMVNTTNPGNGTLDWIAGNFGGQTSDRVVMGNLQGKAQIGGHNNTLSTWADLIINQGGGNVGIGTSTPGVKLEVSGTTRTTTFQMTNNAGTNRVLQSDASGNASWVDPETLNITENDPQVGTNTTNYLSKWNGTSLISSGIFDNGTNVGIGTATPGAKLDIAGTTRTTNFQMTINAGTNRVLQSDAAGNANWVDPATLTITETDPQVGINTTNFLSKWNGTSLVTSGVFDNGTNVGIGTTTPVRKLEVKGDIAQGSWLENIPNRRIGVMDASLHVAGMEIENTTLSGNYSQKLHLLTHHFANGFGRRLTISETGRVGIGTETPINRLDIEGALAVGNSYSGTNTAPVNGAIIEGNVGIGTNNPSSKLHVEGKIRIVDGSQAVSSVLVSDANGEGTWVPFPAENDPQVSMSTNHAVPRWNTTYNTLEAGGLYNTDTGVGVGTSTPDATLDVNGTVIIGNQGTLINNIIKVDYTMPASIVIAANDSQTISFSVPNASIGSTVFVSPQNSLPEFVIIAFGRVSSTGNVSIRLLNVGSSNATVSVNTFNTTIIE